MSFLSSILCCCGGQVSDSEKQNAEIRRNRILATTEAYYNNQEQLSYNIPGDTSKYPDVPPAYHDAIHEPVIVPDEKPLPRPPPPAITANHHTPASLQSRRSSVISIPSTRLSDLTSLRTGDNQSITRDYTGRTVRSINSSLSASRPPSYFSSRSSSPSSRTETEPDVQQQQPLPQHQVQRDILTQHPVMSNDWLDILRQDARRC